MGIAAYNRGTALIRRQIDEEQPRESNTLRLIEERKEHKAERDELREQIKQLEKTIAEQKQTIDELRDNITCQQSEINRFRHHAAAMRELSQSYQRNWRRSSELLRLLPSDKVHQLRELRDMHERESSEEQ